MNPNPYYVDSNAQFQTRVDNVLTGLAPVDIGTLQPASAQSEGSVAIGAHAGIYGQSDGSVAIGERAGHTGQSESAIALGAQAGQTQQSTEAVSLGNGAGSLLQQPQAVAIGAGAGNALQATGAVALGANAGQTQQGANSVAVGAVGQGAFAGSVVLNATGNALNVSGSDRSSIAPLRDAPTGDQLLTYSSSELVRATTLNFNPTINGNLRTGKLTRNPPPSRSISAPPFPASTANFTKITNLPTINKWWGGVLAPNGKIYGMASLATTVLIIDPSTDTIDTSSIQNLTENVAIKWNSGVLGPNGKIYATPYDSSSVLIIDPVTNTTSTITVSSTANKWWGAALATNGKVYNVPRGSGAGNVLIVDPATNTVDTTSIVGLDTANTDKYVGAVATSDGKVYGVPSGSTNVLIVDPSSPVSALTFTSVTYDNTNRELNGTATLFTSELTVGDNVLITASGGTFTGYVESISSNVKVKFLYALGTTVGTISNIQKTRRADVTTIQGLSGTSKWFGGTLAPDGKIYGIPRNSTSVLIIDPSSPVSALTFNPGTPPTYNNTTRTLTGTGTLFTSELTFGDNVLLTTSTGNFTGYVQSITNDTTLVFLYALGTIGTISNLQKTRRADVTAIQGLAGTDKWSTGVVAPSGKIFCTSYSSTSVLIIDPSSPVSTLTFTLSGLNPVAAVYNDATRALTGNGTLFTSELTVGDNVLLITSTGNFTGYVQSITSDISLVFLYALGTSVGAITGLQKTRRADVTTISGLSTTTAKWAGGALAPNGQFYGVPYLADNIFKVDPVLNTINSSFLIPRGAGKYAGGVLGADGKIYAVPQNSSSVMIIDPNTDTYDLTTITGLARDSVKWAGGVLWTDQNMYFVPSFSSSVLIVDPTSPITVLSGTATLATYTDSSRTLVCPSAFFTSELSVGDNVLITTSTPSGNYTGYVQYAANSTTVVFLYALGADLPAGTIINLRKTRKADVTTITGILDVPNQAKYVGANIGLDGKMYCPARDATSMLIIDPASPITPLSGTFTLATYTNSSRTLVCPNGIFTSELSVGDNILITTTAGEYTGYVQYVADSTTVVFLYALGVNLPVGSILNLRKTRKADVTTIRLWTQVRKFGTGALAPNGKIYIQPYDLFNFMIFDPSSPITALSGTFSSASYTDTSPARTLVCPGALFLTELSAGDNVLFSTTTGDYVGYVVTAPSSNTTIVFGYAMGVNLPAGSILNLRKTRKADVAQLGGFTGSSFQFWGMVTAPNGLLYSIADSRGSMAVINPTTNTSTQVGVPVYAQGMTRGGILAQNGLIYAVPFRTITNVPIITPSTNSINQTTITGLPSVGDRWLGAVLAPNGKIYCMPFDSSSVLIINPGLPSIPVPWMLNPSFNKL